MLITVVESIPHALSKNFGHLHFLKFCMYLSIMKLEHIIFPHGYKVSPVPPPEMLLKLLDGLDREVRLGDVHDVVPVPA